MRRTTVLYSGNVQGVGFRYTAQRLAKSFMVTGRVRNLPDGRVELIVEGKPAEVDALLAAIADRLAANIADAAIETSPASGTFDGFAIGV